MDLQELYQMIVLRQDVPYTSLKPKMRIAVVAPNGNLDVMKVDRVGAGRPSLDEEMRQMAVAKVCPGQASMTLSREGVVCLNELLPIEAPGELYFETGNPRGELGVLSSRLWKAYWVDLDESTVIKRIQKSEMRAIQGSYP